MLEFIYCFHANLVPLKFLLHADSKQLVKEDVNVLLQLERQCHDLRSEQHVTKVENVKLKQTNDELTMELEQSSQDLILAQEQLSLLQEQSTQLHEEKERSVTQQPAVCATVVVPLTLNSDNQSQS